MSFEDLLGRHARLAIRRFGPPGAYLAVGHPSDPPAPGGGAVMQDILLIGSETPDGAKVGDEVDVFVHLDSEARPIATTRVAKLELGEVAFLRVTECTQYGAFVDWGLAKELLVPFAEQTAEMHVGSRYPVGLYIDDTRRLAGTMRVSEMLGRETASFQDDEWVQGEAWRDDPAIGLFVIIERAFIGLVPKDEPHTLSRGEAARFRVSNVLPDGKVELSLRGHAHEELGNDARKILDVLGRPGAPKIGDKSSPEEIRDVFGLSKKAFKRAVGRLLKERSVSIDALGFLSVVSRPPETGGSKDGAASKP